MIRAILLLGALHGLAQAQASIDQIVRAVCQVETGVTYQGVGDIRGHWSRGSAGEVSPWQIGPDVLRDLGRLDQAGRIHRDPVYAESIFRLWYLRLRQRAGSDRAALGMFHRGPGGYSGHVAREYADRVLNLVETYQ